MTNDDVAHEAVRQVHEAWLAAELSGDIEGVLALCDCDRDFRAVLERGAVALDPPSNKAWGARAAYVQGPGRLKFEIEGPLSESATPAT